LSERFARQEEQSGLGILAVEMEAAALYTFARAAGARVLCLAHVTNTMGQSGDDFEKGEADGTNDALAVLDKIVSALFIEATDLPAAR
jgi:purine-nucleoside phosphorylase